MRSSAEVEEECAEIIARAKAERLANGISDEWRSLIAAAMALTPEWIDARRAEGQPIMSELA